VAAHLREFGAIPVIAPMINFASSENGPALDDAFARLQAGEFDWIVITSATTVDVLMSQRVIIPERTKVAAVGETTGAALTLAGYRVDYVPEVDNSARGLVKEWPRSDISGRVLIPQSDIAEPTLVNGLTALGLDAHFVSAYRTVGVPVADSIRTDVASGRIRAILVTSGSVARQIAAQLAPLPPETVIACIGPRTAFDARAAGLTVNVIAESRTAASLVEALAEHPAHLTETSPIWTAATAAVPPAPSVSPAPIAPDDTAPTDTDIAPEA
jgi:uroporphyrinogen-III synthase